MLARTVALDALPALAEIPRSYGRQKLGEAPLNVLCVFDDELYAWVPPSTAGGFADDDDVSEDAEYGLRVFRLKSQRAADGQDQLVASDEYQTLRPKRPLHNARDVRRIVLNGNGTYILLVCTNVVYACPLPPRNPSAVGPAFNNDDIEPILIGRRHHTAHPDSRVLGAQWHALSRNDAHIMVLTDDSVLRLYDLADMKRENGVLRVDRAEQAFTVSSKAGTGRAVAFDTSREATGWSKMAVNVLLSDASVLTLCPVLPRSSRIARSHLLEMRDTAATLLQADEEAANVAYQWITQVLASMEDNGETSHEALCNITSPPVFVGLAPARVQYTPPANAPRDPCGLLCLGSVPPALVIAGKDDSVHVGFIMDQVYGRWDAWEERSRGSTRWLLSQSVPPVARSATQGGAALVPDPLNSDKFFAYDDTGIRRFTFSSLQQATKFISSEESVPSLAPLRVQELVRTVLDGAGSSRPNPVVGLAIVSDLVIGYRLVALLGSGVAVRTLWHSTGAKALNIRSRSALNSSAMSTSQGGGPDLHEEVMAQLADNELPTLKLAADVDDATKLRFLKDYLKKCREERIAKLYDIAALLADRKEQVRVRTADQERKLSELEATLAREEQLASRIRNEAAVLGQELRGACETLRGALEQLEVTGGLSEAEKEYLMELRKMSRNLKTSVVPTIRRMERRADQAHRTLKELEGPVSLQTDKREQDVSETVELLQGRLQKAVAETKKLHQEFDKELNLKGADLL